MLQKRNGIVTKTCFFQLKMKKNAISAFSDSLQPFNLKNVYF